MATIDAISGSRSNLTRLLDRIFDDRRTQLSFLGYVIDIDGFIVGKNLLNGDDALDKQRTEKWGNILEKKDGSPFIIENKSLPVDISDTSAQRVKIEESDLKGPDVATTPVPFPNKITA